VVQLVFVLNPVGALFPAVHLLVLAFWARGLDVP
jgi:hypothetical protein